MNNRLIAAAAFVLVLIAAHPSSAQLAAPNAAGTAIGHVHINAADVEKLKSYVAQAKS